MGGLRMPTTFKDEDEFFISGGTELAFMSASEDFNAALTYARNKPEVARRLRQAGGTE